jgi:hypothetical protein
LHVASTDEIIGLLLTEGANVNARDVDGQTPLHYHISRGDAQTVKLLLSYEADPNISSYSKRTTPLHVACEKANILLVSALVDDSIAIPLDVNALDINGNSSLHFLTLFDVATSEVTSNSKEIDARTCLAYLLHHGAIASTANLSGVTPLHNICGNESLLNLGVGEPIVDLLLEFHADPNARDVEGCTPLIIACMRREYRLCILLMAAGGDMNISCPMDCCLLSKGYKRDISGIQNVPNECSTSDLLPKQPRFRVFSAISCVQTKIHDDSRDRCMNCASLFVAYFGFFSGKHHCRYCQRLLCKECCSSELPRKMFPDFILDEYTENLLRVCLICENVLVTKAKQTGMRPSNGILEEDDFDFGRPSF